MIDIAALRGSTVRDNAGTRGEILSVSLPWVRIGWWDEDSSTPREESFLRSDPRVSSMEILTITEGWVPASAFLGAGEPIEDEIEDDASLAEDLEGLLQEKKPRSPFKTANKIGPAIKNRINRKKDYWDCSGSNYKYKCKGKEGETKIITRDPGKKAKYNKLYKAWWSARQDVAAPNTKLKKKVFKKKKK